MEDVTIELPASMSLVMPVELTNGCTESKCTVESDDVQMTNFLRKHYLEHFGHRDINGTCNCKGVQLLRLHTIGCDCWVISFT